jgi:SAM-dependent methyltransferase
MFTKSAEFYDAIYSWKDYAAESELVGRFIDQYKRSSGSTLLEAACGTGHHSQYLQQRFQVEGFDLDNEMLKVARQRCPNVTFRQADLVNFEMGKQYDVVTCLFSSIGYTATVDKLNRAMKQIAAHLLIGGVAIIEPWFTPDQWESRHVAARFVDLPDLKIARMNVSYTEDGVSVLDFHYMIGTPQGIEEFTEIHRLGLFTDAQYRNAFDQAGLELHHDAQGLDGRGLYLGVKR